MGIEVAYGVAVVACSAFASAISRGLFWGALRIIRALGRTLHVCYVIFEHIAEGLHVLVLLLAPFSDFLKHFAKGNVRIDKCFVDGLP